MPTCSNDVVIDLFPDGSRRKPVTSINQTVQSSDRVLLPKLVSRNGIVDFHYVPIEIRVLVINRGLLLLNLHPRDAHHLLSLSIFSGLTRGRLVFVHVR